MNKPRLLMLAAFIGIAAAAAAQDGSPAEALGLRFQARADQTTSVWHQRRERYERLMTALGGRPAPPPTDASPEAEVVRVARDRLAHPERFRELEDFYVKQWAKQARVPRAIPPQKQHLTQAYRYAWEYLMLLPGDAESAPGFGANASKALSKIHDDASLPLVVDRFVRLTSFPDDPAGRDHNESTLIDHISNYISPSGLDAMLRCANLMEASQTRSGLHAALRTDVADLVRERLTTKDPAGKAEAWAGVVEAYRRDPANRGKLPALALLLDDPKLAKP